METLKVKLIHDKFMPKPEFKNLFHGIYKIIGKQGLGGCYKGYLATLLKQSSNQGVRFFMYENSKQVVKKFIPVPFIVDMLAGAFAGFCSVMLNNPIDVVKTNMQGLEQQKAKGFLGWFSLIYKTEGLKGFYKGVGPRMARVCLDVSLTFTLWNFCKKFLNWVQGKKWSEN